MTFEFSGLVILLIGMVSARVSQGMENGRKYLLFFGIVFLVANLAVLLLVRQSEQESAERTLEEVRHRAGLERIHYERVTTIGKNAFYGDKKLASITFKTTKLTSSKVGSNAFKGIKSTENDQHQK